MYMRPAGIEPIGSSGYGDIDAAETYRPTNANQPVQESQ
jgi:hypothetical protein